MHNNFLDPKNNNIQKSDYAFLEYNVKHPFLETCEKCHIKKPPYSEMKNNIKKCTTCHPFENFYTPQVKSVHPTFVAGTCSNCHAPHGSDLPFSLLKKDPELCLECHPLNLQREKKAHKKFKIFNTGCTSCHEPHLSKFIVLMKKAK